MKQFEKRRKVLNESLMEKWGYKVKEEIEEGEDLEEVLSDEERRIEMDDYYASKD